TASATPTVIHPDDRRSRPAGLTVVIASAGAPGESQTPSDGRYPSPLEQVVTFAEAMTRSTWQEISAEPDTALPAATEIKRQLAHHGWCDLLVGLIQVVEASREALDRIPEAAKSVVKSAILHSSMQNVRTQVTSAVVDVVVDKVWMAFKTAMF